MLLFFFFKQNTAYEMRISDWSSDVCSSDLGTASSRGRPRGPANAVRSIVLRIAQIDRGSRDTAGLGEDAERLGECDLKLRGGESARVGDDLHIDIVGDVLPGGDGRLASGRSDEHTSELQSLMSISYAVFC